MRNSKLILLFCLFLFSCASVPNSVREESDPYLWLEEVESKEALDWVRDRNEKSTGVFEKDPLYKELKRPISKILLSKDRIPYGTYRNGYVYNFWQDDKNVRGLWRRTRLKEYRKSTPKWDVLVDFDKLARVEKENWVYKGVDCLAPAYTRCLLKLSRGGKDAVVVREFDLAKRNFVQGGFTVPEAKTRVTWVNEDTLLIGSDFGPGSLTRSGYPRTVRLWKRGVPLGQAPQIFEGEESDVAVDPFSLMRPDGSAFGFVRAVTFFENEYYAFDPQAKTVRRIDIPKESELMEAYAGRFLVLLRAEWRAEERIFKAGSLVAVPFQNDSAPEEVYAPDERSSIKQVAATRGSVFVYTLENVRGRAWQLERTPTSWEKRPVPVEADSPMASLSPVSSDAYTNIAFVGFESFLTPPSVYEYNSAKASPARLLKQLPKRFEANGFTVSQYEAVSKDGTKVPYFLIHGKNVRLNGQNPTLLYGYGGFEIPMTPRYLDVVGATWLKRGGVYAIANIRGGGEFGPKWHQAALKHNRQRAYDDFIGVAENLIARKLTSSSRLGIMGGSNGGLLMGAMFTQRPELFGAVVCKVPLLDMIRYTKLLAGHSWIGEYGDPEIAEDREAILRYSPYQNVKAGTKYPKIFFLTSTKDDRVHPGHARKMVAKMESQGHPVYYFENIEGGHGAAANLDQKIRMLSLEFTYLSRQLGL